MKTSLLALLSVLLLPLALGAQDEPPPGLAPAELDRSRACVPALARLGALEREMEPLARRADRIRALHQAITLEDADRVAPFDEAAPLEVAVREWFAEDAELGRRYAEAEDESVLEERRERRRQILDRLQEGLEAVSAEAQRTIAEEELDEASWYCQDVVLVRSAVLEACGSLEGPVCEAARAEDPGSRYRFVDTPELLWEIEQMRPWSDPSPLHPSPEGGLAGAQAGVMARRGNIVLELSLGSLIQDRSSLSQEDAAEFDAHLSAMGIPFDHPDFVMVPALTLWLDTPAPLAGEEAYLLHFGDLSEPAEQVIRSLPASAEGPLDTTFAAQGWVLERLAEGEEVWLTAVRMADSEPEEMEEMEAEALYSLNLTALRQSEAVGQLLTYWTEGEFARDLAELVPPGGSGSGGR